MCHCFQRRQSKALIQRRENKNLSLIVKSAQHLDRNESQEAHIVLYSASDYSPPQIGIARYIVSNNDELQVGIRLIFFQLRFQSRESFDHPNHVLVRTDSSGVEQEGIVHLVALGNQLTVGGARMPVQETFIDRDVDHLDAI